MSTVEKIKRHFDPLEVCKGQFDDLKAAISVNMQTKRSNSGRDVNSLGLPEATSGETEASLRTIAEWDGDNLTISFVGRKGIKGIDEGYSPSEVRAEHGTVQNLYYELKPWARTKEARYGLPDKSINPWSVATNIWEKGTVLYRQGGGTEMMKGLLPEVVRNIEREFHLRLDKQAYNFIKAEIDDIFKI